MPRAPLGRWILLVAGITGGPAACGDETTPVAGDVPPECNPLGHPGAGCLLPWPSSAYHDGEGVELPLEAMPINLDDRQIDPTTWNRFDGFSPTGALIAG